MKKLVLLCMSLVLLSAQVIFAYPGGVSGYTKKSGSAGCGCHGSSYFNTTVLVQITGPDTVKSGSTNVYTVRVSGGPSTKAGVDISASSGTLATNGSYLKLLNSEITHSSAPTYVSGGYDFSIKYTAPATIGTQTLYATGSSKKYWNFANNKTITVVSATANEAAGNISDKNYTIQDCYPNPFNNETRLTVQLATSCNLEVNLYDVMGRSVGNVYSGYVNPGMKNIPIVMTNQASGLYFVRVIAKETGTGATVVNRTQRIIYLK